MLWGVLFSHYNWPKNSKLCIYILTLILFSPLKSATKENVFASCATGHHHQLRRAPAMAAVYWPFSPQSPNLSLWIHLSSHTKPSLFPPKLRCSHSPHLPRNPNHPSPLLIILPLRIRRVGILGCIARRTIDCRRLRYWSENNWGNSRCNYFGRSFLVPCLVEAVCFSDHRSCDRAFSWRSEGAGGFFGGFAVWLVA